jgi:hypothetical protein
MMAVFYRGPCVRITHEAFQTWGHAPRSYLLNHLAELRVVQRPVGAPPAVVRTRLASTGVAGTVSLAAGLGWVAGWQIFESPALVVIMVGMLLASALVSIACWRVRPAELVLAASYRGRPVLLYRSTRRAEFDGVTRGLVRALDRLADRQ